MDAKDDEFILLSDLELPASEAVQFAVSLWAEGLLIPQANDWTYSSVQSRACTELFWSRQPVYKQTGSRTGFKRLSRAENLDRFQNRLFTGQFWASTANQEENRTSVRCLNGTYYRGRNLSCLKTCQRFCSLPVRPFCLKKSPENSLSRKLSRFLKDCLLKSILQPVFVDRLPHSEAIFYFRNSRMVTAEEFKAKIESWGIPASDFIDDVGKYLSEKYKGDGPEIGTDSAEAALRKLDELLQKYKMFEAGLAEKVNFFNPFMKQAKKLFNWIMAKKWRSAASRENIKIFYFCLRERF